MLIGILSDSHGHADTVRAALQRLDEAGVERLVHCGDVGGLAVFEAMAGHDVRFVWGNTDWPSEELTSEVERLGIPLPEDVPLLLEWGGKRIAVFHGHEREFRHAVDSPDVDYILYGHTHLKADARRGCARCVNPGALHRATTRTVATLDVKTDKLRFIEIPRRQAIE